MAQYVLELDETIPEGLKYTARTSNEPLNAPLAVLLIFFSGGLVSLSWSYLALLPAALLCRLFSAARATEESIEIQPSIGLQLTNARCLAYTFALPFSSTSATRIHYTLLLAKLTRYSPGQKHVRLVINEGLQGCSARFYLAVIKGEGEKAKEVQVVFPTILPRQEDLERVLKEAQPHLQV
ncbi:hypothetical protein JCM11251_001816 [Rhodosporidiobolus azoricus]